MKIHFALIAVLPFFILSACSQSHDASEVVSRPEATAIIGGTAAEPTDRVTSSTLYLQMRDQKMQTWNCTGTLISKNLVLTAAHCLKGIDEPPAQVLVFLGAVKPTDNDASGFVPAADWVYHQDFKTVIDIFKGTFGSVNDVGLVKLNEDSLLTGIPVPVLNETSEIIPGEELTLAGYGIVNEIGDVVPSKGLNHTTINVAKLVDMFIVTDQTQGRGGCNGDSGGPAYLTTESGFIVVGITRGAHHPSRDCRHYGEYTNVTHFKSFIQEQATVMGAELPVFVDRP